MANPNVRFEGPGTSEYSLAVTPSLLTADNKPTPWRALRVGAAGAVELVQPNGDMVIYPNCVAGEKITCRAVRVNTTNTTVAGANSLIAEW